MRSSVLLVSVFLAGCVSPAQWTHPQLQGKANAADLATLATADCYAYAAGRAPAPQPVMGYMPTPAPTSYTTYGTASTYGNQTAFNATTYSSGGFASGFAAGSNAGASLGNAIVVSQARRRIKNISDACMRTQGWVDASTPEGKEELQSATPASAGAAKER